MKRWTVFSSSVASLVLTIAAALSAEVPVAGELASARSTTEASRRQLRRSSIQAPRDNDNNAPNELQAAIEQLRRSMYRPKPAPAKPVAEPPAPTTRPAKAKPKLTPTTRPATTQPAMTAFEIKERIRKINNVEDPTALGDVLFQAKRPKLAAIFYERAIKGKTTGESGAWAMFQAGNCRRTTDPQAAVKAYDALVAANPKSLWSSIALVQKNIITWRKTNNLAALSKDIEKQSRQSSGSTERK